MNDAERAAGGPARDAGRLLLELLFPGRCLLCGDWLFPQGDHSIPLCDTCRGGLSRIQGESCATCGMRLVSERGTCLRCRDAGYAFASNTALFAYSGAAKELVGKLKFEGRTRLAALFADFAAEAMKADKSRDMVSLPVVPVPPRPGRQRPDAVELVARGLARRHGRLVQRLLLRTGGAPQKSLDLVQRRENLRGRVRMAHASDGFRCPPSVILLDDVFTTGATLDACARILLNAGCAAVYGVTLAIEE